MKRFAILLALLMTVFATPVFAQSATGLFFDPARDGEGVLMFQRDNMIQLSFFTYIERCNHRYFADEAFIEDKSYVYCRKQQAWYITGAIPIDSGQAIGVLYTANPLEIDEDVDTLLAETIDIGLAVITQTATGFDMIVLRTGEALSPDADIYHRTYHFEEYLFGPTMVNPLSGE